MNDRTGPLDLSFTATLGKVRVGDTWNDPDSGVEPGEGWLRETARLRDWIAGRTAWMDDQLAGSDG